MGPPRRLETTYFVWDYRLKDAAVVAEAAPKLDILYATLRHNFGLDAAPTTDKQQIEVSVTQPPGQMLYRPAPGAPVVVASPALYLAPAELSDPQLLMQSLALPLVEDVLAQAAAYYGAPSGWQMMQGGLRLWQLWDLRSASQPRGMMRWCAGSWSNPSKRTAYTSSYRTITPRSVPSTLYG